MKEDLIKKYDLLNFLYTKETFPLESDKYDNITLFISDNLDVLVGFRKDKTVQDLLELVFGKISLLENRSDFLYANIVLFYEKLQSLEQSKHFSTFDDWLCLLDLLIKKTNNHLYKSSLFSKIFEHLFPIFMEKNLLKDLDDSKYLDYILIDEKYIMYLDPEWLLQSDEVLGVFNCLSKMLDLTFYDFNYFDIFIQNVKTITGLMGNNYLTIDLFSSDMVKHNYYLEFFKKFNKELDTENIIVDIIDTDGFDVVHLLEDYSFKEVHRFCKRLSEEKPL